MRRVSVARAFVSAASFQVKIARITPASAVTMAKTALILSTVTPATAFHISVITISIPRVLVSQEGWRGSRRLDAVHEARDRVALAQLRLRLKPPGRNCPASLCLQYHRSRIASRAGQSLGGHKT